MGIHLQVAFTAKEISYLTNRTTKRSKLKCSLNDVWHLHVSDNIVSVCCVNGTKGARAASVLGGNRARQLPAPIIIQMLRNELSDMWIRSVERLARGLPFAELPGWRRWKMMFRIFAVEHPRKERLQRKPPIQRLGKLTLIWLLAMKTWPPQSRLASAI
jgi:hypothetical protein